MKKVTLYLYLLVAALFVFSCEEEDNMDEVGNWEITAPVLSTPSSGSDLILDESAPAAQINFAWDAAVASNRFIVAYRFLLIEANSTDYSNPVLEIVPSAAGKDRFVKPTAQQIDYALSAKCYEAGEAVELKWVVVATAINKEAVASSPITITRFETETTPETLYITGAATEAGADVANATLMRAKLNADGETTGVFDVYTTLTEGATFSFREFNSAVSRTYGVSNNAIAKCGGAITAPATGQYRVTVDLNNNSYNLWKVDKWSLVGDAVPGGWGGDVPLTYQGNGVWSADVEFLKPYDGAGFIFRANGDWGYIIKQIKGTVAANGKSGRVILESEKDAAGVEVEDSKIADTGIHTVTLNLSAGAYSFSLVPKATPPGENLAVIGKTTSPDADAVSGNFVFGDYDTPTQLYLVSEGNLVAELTKDGDSFTSKYLALQKSKKYILNSESDGSGTTYNEVGEGEISVDHDQAYTLTVDFAAGKLFWKHYNLKLFHWDEPGGGWDQRQELLMTYTHPYKFEVTADLTAGYHSKFVSPWAVQFGTSSTALTGTMTNSDPSPNFTGINSTGTYKATLVVSDDFVTGEYSFVKQ
jgi:starch-binding outer membrane protein SusE/F